MCTKSFYLSAAIANSAAKSFFAQLRYTFLIRLESKEL